MYSNVQYIISPADRWFYLRLVVIFALGAVSAWAQVTGTATQNTTIGTTVMGATITITDTTTQAQRDARKISFSWTGRINKVMGSGTNGAMTAVDYAPESNTTPGTFLNYQGGFSRNDNYSYDTTQSGTYVSPNPYPVGKTYVDIRLRARVIASSTTQDVVTVRISLTPEPDKGITLKITNGVVSDDIYTGSISVMAGRSGGTPLLVMSLVSGETRQTTIDVGSGAAEIPTDGSTLYLRADRTRKDGRYYSTASSWIAGVKETHAGEDYPLYSFTVPHVGPVVRDSTSTETDETPTPHTPDELPPDEDDPVIDPNPTPTPAPSPTPKPPTPTPPAPTPGPITDPPVWTDGSATTDTRTVISGGYVITTVVTTGTDADGNTSTAVSQGGNAVDGTEGEEAAEQAADYIPDAGRAPRYTVGGSEPSFMVTMPSQFGGKSFDLNPFRADRLGPVVDWFRVALAWLCIISYGVWISKEVAEWTKGMSTIRQAQGNAVMGGTGGQATALLAAAAITVAVAVFMVALIAWLAGDIVTIGTMIQTIGINPMAGAPAGVAWMLDKTFPIATMLTCLVARMTFNFYAAKIFAVAMTTIRFIVP